MTKSLRGEHLGRPIKVKRVRALIGLSIAVAALLFAFGLSIFPSHVYADKKPSNQDSENELLPDIRPVKDTMMDHDLVKDPATGNILLRFAMGIGNYGEGRLEVVGKRDSVDSNENSMPAYQRVYTEDGTYDEVKVGELTYHPEHHHYHFENAVAFRLVDPDSGQEISGRKEAFCLADVDVVDDTLEHYSQTPEYNQCYPNPGAKYVRMGVSVGWQDIYGKDLVGQAFDVTDLMKKPAKEYVLEHITNPDGSLVDANKGKPQKTSIKVVIGEGEEVGVGKSRPGV